MNDMTNYMFRLETVELNLERLQSLIECLTLDFYTSSNTQALELTYGDYKNTMLVIKDILRLQTTEMIEVINKLYKLPKEDKSEVE